MSNNSLVLHWYEVLLVRRQDWVPACAEDVNMGAYSPSNGWVHHDFLPGSTLFTVLEFMQRHDGAIPERPMRYYDILHVCKTHSQAAGGIAFGTADYMAVPRKQLAHFLPFSSVQPIGSADCLETCLVELKSPMRQSFIHDIKCLH